MITRFLQKNKKILSFLLKYFDYSSKITLFVFHNVFFFVVLSISLTLIPILYNNEILNFFIYLVDNGIFSFFNALKILPLYLKIFFSFYFLCIEIVIINTMLLHNNYFKQEIFLAYGNSFLKDRKYNNPYFTAGKGAFTTVCLFGGLCIGADVWKFDRLVKATSETNRQAIEAGLPDAIVQYPKLTPLGETLTGLGKGIKEIFKSN